MWSPAQCTRYGWEKVGVAIDRAVVRLAVFLHIHLSEDKIANDDKALICFCKIQLLSVFRSFTDFNCRLRSRDTLELNLLQIDCCRFCCCCCWKILGYSVPSVVVREFGGLQHIHPSIHPSRDGRNLNPIRQTDRFESFKMFVHKSLGSVQTRSCRAPLPARSSTWAGYSTSTLHSGRYRRRRVARLSCRGSRDSMVRKFYSSQFKY